MSTVTAPTLRELKRVFVNGKTRLPDPDPNASPERAVELLSIAHPELNNAVVDAPSAIDGELVYKLKVNVGTKG